MAAGTTTCVQFHQTFPAGRYQEGEGFGYARLTLLQVQYLAGRISVGLFNGVSKDWLTREQIYLHHIFLHNSIHVTRMIIQECTS